MTIQLLSLQHNDFLKYPFNGGTIRVKLGDYFLFYSCVRFLEAQQQTPQGKVSRAVTLTGFEYLVDGVRKRRHQR